MGHTQTIFNHAVMEANSSLNKVSINEGDLIIAKEYLFFRTPDVNDIVVYPYDDKIQISIVEAIYEDKEGIPTYKVTPDNSELPVNLYKDDITGELYIIADGLGKLGLFVISPTFIILLYSVVGCFFVLIKKLDKKVKNNVAEDKTNIASVNDSSESTTSNNSVESNSSLDENVSDLEDNIVSTEPNEIDSTKETSIDEEVGTSSSEDNTGDNTDSNSSETELKDAAEVSDEIESDIDTATDTDDSSEETTENTDIIEENEDTTDDTETKIDGSNEEDIILENEDNLSSNEAIEEVEKVEEIIVEEDKKEIKKELVIKTKKDKALHNKIKNCNKKIKSIKCKKTHFNKHNRKKNNKRKTKHINKYTHSKKRTINRK